MKNMRSAYGRTVETRMRREVEGGIQGRSYWEGRIRVKPWT